MRKFIQRVMRSVFGTPTDEELQKERDAIQSLEERSKKMDASIEQTKKEIQDADGAIAGLKEEVLELGGDPKFLRRVTGPKLKTVPKPSALLQRVREILVDSNEVTRTRPQVITLLCDSLNASGQLDPLIIAMKGELDVELLCAALDGRLDSAVISAGYDKVGECFVRNRRFIK